MEPIIESQGCMYLASSGSELVFTDDSVFRVPYDGEAGIEKIIRKKFCETSGVYMLG
jgi:hypothetical protein